MSTRVVTSTAVYDRYACELKIRPGDVIEVVSPPGRSREIPVRTHLRCTGIGNDASLGNSGALFGFWRDPL